MRLEYSICPTYSRIQSPLFVVAYVYTLPESPRWLLMKARQGNKKKYEEAFMSLCKLRHTKLQAGRDLFLIDHLLEGEEAIMQQQKPFSELFTLGRNRRALTASVITMFLQQFCGVNVTVRTHHYSLSAPRANIPGLLLQHDPHPARWLRPSCRPPHLHGLRHH